MPRPLMYQSEPWQVFEITMRCQQGRFLLRPGSESNRRILGVLGRSLEVYGQHVRLHFSGGTSNHLHFIASFENAEFKARWKSHVKTNISKELGELHDWSGCHWDRRTRRTRDIAILDDGALVDRLMYLAAHGVKDGLVETPGHWPGIQWPRAVTEGETLRGIWYDRTRLWALRAAWKPGGPTPKPTLMDVAEWKPVPLTPPPMWAGLPPAALQSRWRELVEEALLRHPAPSRVLGAAAVLAADPHDKPIRSKRSPAPMVHTRCRKLRAMWWAGYRAFVEACRQALDALRAGCDAVFPPEGCRPPCLFERGG